MIPIVILPDLRKAIDILEKHRGWRLLDAAPARRAFPGGKPCCADMVSKKVGEALTIKFMPSDFQGDTDDAHNFDELSDPTKRVEVENTIDWVAIMHFWEPALVLDTGNELDMQKAGTAEGFMLWDQMPEGYWPALRKRFANVK
jgi:hypothetical protein